MGNRFDFTTQSRYNINMNEGRMYYGDLQEAISHYEGVYDTKPLVIYCNPDEFVEAELERIEMKFPKNNFVLTHRKE